MGRAKGPTYQVPFRRRREARTNYRLRYKLLKSGKPLFVVRRSLKYIYVSIVKPDIGGDKTIVSVSSKILKDKYGWYGLKNTPAAYLTGYIAGKYALKKGVKEAILNLGVAWSRNASIPYAAVMGARDAGLDVPMGEEVLVDEDRIKGVHIAEYAKLLKERDPDLFKRRFSIYLELGIDPMKIPEMFEDVKNKIASDLGDIDG